MSRASVWIIERAWRDRKTWDPIEAASYDTLAEARTIRDALRRGDRLWQYRAVRYVRAVQKKAKRK
jgi:hypothetical protein